MNCKHCLFVTSALTIACVAGAIAVAQQDGKAHTPKADPHAAKPTAQPAGQPEMKLPPGWTAEDMQACAVAGMPGENHAFLASHAGTWVGKETMWMGAGAEPMHITCTTEVKPMFENRYTRMTHSGEMPGWGEFHGEATMGYDNLAGNFICSWIDNMGTGAMQGTGTLSPDKKTLKWTYNYTCPITKKPAVMRETDTFISDNEMKMEMWGMDPKQNKEYKMIEINYTRK
ncbi:MAG: DUF1579 domain-containing protein [Phycisphaerales bacterium]